MDSISHIIYDSTTTLPDNWDMVASGNIFLSRKYLAVLETSGPANMECQFIGFYKEAKLCGVALAQFLDVSRLTAFGDRERCLKTSVRNFFFRTFPPHVLFIGNNMLTGQNAFALAEGINISDIAFPIERSIADLSARYRKKGKRIHITAIKDFRAEELTHLERNAFKGYHRFSTQPNMVFDIPGTWKSEADYIAALSKKYRDQYKRSHKRAEGIRKSKMHLEDILLHEQTIYELYLHVAQNAPFNTFLLSKGHFADFKRKLGDQFLFYGYFLDERLVGFNTLIRNGDQMDTYFLGYDDTVQKEKMLYLNMLYDMISYSINKGFKEVVFARTALEIKSSVGAVPLEMYGLIRHVSPLVNRYVNRIFAYLDPKVEWHQRHPFKEHV